MSTPQTTRGKPPLTLPSNRDMAAWLKPSKQPVASGVAKFPNPQQHDTPLNAQDSSRRSHRNGAFTAEHSQRSPPSSPNQQGNAGHRYAPPFPWPLLIESRCFPIQNNLLAHVPTTIRLHAL